MVCIHLTAILCVQCRYELKFTPGVPKDDDSLRRRVNRSRKIQTANRFDGVKIKLNLLSLSIAHIHEDLSGKETISLGDKTDQESALDVGH